MTRAIEIIQHAIWHCQFGSGVVDRVPDRADLDAIVILLRVLAQVEGEKN